MIIIGYYCIGKSYTSRMSKDYIDLNNYNFVSADGYCNMALELSNQGYIVFVSSHKSVRKYLSNYQHKEKIIEIFPSLSLKDKWINKVKERYEQTKFIQDQISLDRVKKFYQEDIEDIWSDDIKEKIVIDNINYTLDYIIDNIVKENYDE